MIDIEKFVMRVKPKLERFLRDPTKENLSLLEEELSTFDGRQIKIVHGQILLPLILKLESLKGY